MKFLLPKLRAAPFGAVWLWLALIAPGAAADGPVSAAQEILREQNFYVGEPTGRLDAQTAAAVRRFQLHTGLPASGELDASTLSALEAAAHPDSTDDSARERSSKIIESDADFLARIEEAPPEPKPPATERAPEEANRRLERAPAAEASSKKISEAEARQFVVNYLEAAEGATPERETAFYADEVNYFDSGHVSRAFVAKDQRAYYRRWPNRKFQLVGEPELLKATEESAVVRFTMRYSLASAKERADGRTDNVVRLRRTSDGLRIVSISERKLGP